MLHYTTLHILASISLLFTWHFVTNVFFIYISNVLYAIYVWQIPWLFENGYSFTFYDCFSTLRVMPRRKIMHKDISLLLKHNAFTCHFNIRKNIPLAFCTIDYSLSPEKTGLCCKWLHRLAHLQAIKKQSEYT